MFLKYNKSLKQNSQTLRSGMGGGTPPAKLRLVAPSLRGICGFTLIELIVAISIIVLVTTLSTVNFRSYSFQGQADLSALKLSSDLRLVQSYAFGLKDYQAGQRPDGGWGLFFRTAAGVNDEYVFFADWTGATAGVFDHRRQADGTEDHKSVDLGGVRISRLTIGNPGSEAAVDALSIVMQPPNPTIWVCDYPPGTIGCSATTTAQIFFGSNGKESSVTLNTFGMIDVNE